MERVKKGLSALLSIIVGMIFTGVYAATSPIGYWKILDNATGKPQRIVNWQTQDGMLMGKVIKVFSLQNNSTLRCTACRGEFRNQPLVGMVILSHLKSRNNQWGNGKILDPENGKTYSCSLKLADNGKHLKVHNYIGIPVIDVPLIGKSQIWERVDLMSDADHHRG